ncbi:MAG: type II secretion system protein GspI [Gammaproteobacteria bacterium]|nr:MAG: type II secretion system protein GspI [Gammaproteobacteria bacterium]RLA36056.1 MAG: type II secretion system protein GspI [Gammaproteobacteria bacterium]
MISKRSKRSAGFTLIEVMVALAIVGLSLGAVAASVSQMVDAATTMRERTYASWIAQNKIAELRLANVVPEVSDTSGEVEYAGLDWAWRANISETGVENLFRVDVAISYPGADVAIRTVSGFIGEPGILGESNRAWLRNSQAVGEDQ